MCLNRLRFISNRLSLMAKPNTHRPPVASLSWQSAFNTLLFAGNFLTRLSRFVYINCTAWLFLKVDLNYTHCIMRLDRK